jgi:hypothetical protein
MDYVTVEIPKDVLLGLKGWARKKSQVVFIAFRMNDAASREMRAALERSIAEIDSEVVVLDGHVSQGTPWANEVRKRIGRSRLIVIDVTGPSREVMFELGFASNKPFIPVVHRAEDRDELPSWLTAFQISVFEEAGLPRLAADVVSTLRTAMPKSSTYRRPPAAPGLIVWLESRRSSVFGDCYDRFASLAQQFSLHVERIDPLELPSFDDLRKVLRAWMVIACLDGGSADYAGHFFLGDIAGRGRAGAGGGKGQSVIRRGLVLLPTEADPSLIVADSVRRVSRSILTVVTSRDMLKEARPLFTAYRRWLLSDVGEL